LIKVTAESARMYEFLSIDDEETRQSSIREQVANFAERALTSSSFGYPTKIQLDQNAAKSLGEFLITVQSSDIIEGCVIVVGNSYLESTFEEAFFNQLMISIVISCQKSDTLSYSHMFPISNG